MVDRTETDEQIELERLGSLDLVLGGVVHEINNAVHSVALNLPLIREVWEGAVPVLDRAIGGEPGFRLANLPYSELREELPLVLIETLRGTERIKKLLGALVAYAGGSAPALATVHLNDVLDDLGLLMGGVARKATRTFVIEPAADLPPVHGVRGRLLQLLIAALMQLCRSPDGKDVDLTVRTVDRTGEGWVGVEFVRSKSMVGHGALRWLGRASDRCRARWQDRV